MRMLVFVLLMVGAVLVCWYSLPITAVQGHETGQTMPSNCQFCGSSLMWKGETQMVGATSWYVLVCAQGHRTLARTPNGAACPCGQ
jgi:hypothetical protein